MNNFNDRLRAMFDLIGANITNVGKQLIGPDQTKQPKIKTKSVVKTSASKASTKSSTKSLAKSSSKNDRSVSRASTGKGTTSRDSRRTVQSRKSNQTVPVSPLTNVFAPRLLHLGTASFDDHATDPDQNCLSLKWLAANRYNVAVYLIHCPTHNKMAVTKPSARQALWMPFMPIPTNRSWEEAGLAALFIILSGANMDLLMSLKDHPPFSDVQLMEILDVQLPHTMDVVTRLTWYVRLETKMPKKSGFKCCKNTDMLQWIETKDITEQNETILEYAWGMELVEKTAVLAAYQAVQTIHSTYDEYSLAMAFKYVPRQPPADNEQQLLCSANLSEKDIERLYGDFQDHCFPCTAMTVHSFKVYMTKYGLQYHDERLWAYFRAFNFNQNGVITFPELLLGLACMDSKSVHNETRAKVCCL